MGTLNVYAGAAFDEGVSSVTATPSVNLGERRVWEGAEWVYCQNVGGATITTEKLVKVITGASGYSVSMTAPTDVAHPCVGACVNTQVTNASYFWALTRGFCTLETTNSTITGDIVPLGMSTEGGIGTYNGVVTNLAIGYAMNADTASAGSAYCFLRTGF